MLKTESDLFIILDSNNEYVGTYNLTEAMSLYLNDSSFKENITYGSFKVYVQNNKKFLETLHKGLRFIEVLERIER